MHGLDRARQMIVLAVSRIGDIGRHRKARCAGDGVQPPRLQERLHDTARKESGAAILQEMLQSEPADVHRQRGAGEIRKQRGVTRVEFGSPIDIDIARPRLRRALRIGRHQDELLLEQLLDLEAGAALRRVHHADIDASLDQPLHQLGLERALGADRDVGMRARHQRQPAQQILLPKADAAADHQRRGKSLGDSDVMARLLDGADQHRGVALKLPARRRQRGAGLVAHEQHAAELLLERVDAGADGRLADMQPLRRGDEVAGAHHRQERPGQFGIHGASTFESIKSISKAPALRMSKSRTGQAPRQGLTIAIA
ncbi:hypothetical protein M2212_005096 [Bradyrhizobium elkanii]|nr:hypothetical protein [Bradyrhizobium elkanii]